MTLKTKLLAQNVPVAPQQSNFIQLKNAGAHLIMWLVWLPWVAVLSVPSFLYIVSTVTQPGDNIYGLNAATLYLAHQGIGPVLVFINKVIFPKLARWLSSRMLEIGDKPSQANTPGSQSDGSNQIEVPQEHDEAEAPSPTADDASPPVTGSNVAGNLLMMAAIATSLLVPIVSTMMLNQDCAAFWIRAWQPCQNGTKFNLTIDLPQPTLYGLVVPPVHFEAIRHEDVCPSLTSFSIANKGKCVRSIMGVTSSLLLAKLTFSAFASSALAVALLFPKAGARVERIAQRVTCNPLYHRRQDLDLEWVSIVLYFLYGVIFGCVTPALLPLLAITLWTSRAVFHHAVHERHLPIGTRATLSQGFMLMLSISSLAVACLLIVSFYTWNNLHGAWLAYVGMPCGALGGYAVFRCTDSGRSHPEDMLQDSSASLLAHASQVASEQTAMPTIHNPSSSLTAVPLIDEQSTVGFG